VLRFGDTVVLFRAPVPGAEREAISLATEQRTHLPRPTNGR
jgi:hypothetical protein